MLAYDARDTTGHGALRMGGSSSLMGGRGTLKLSSFIACMQMGRQEHRVTMTLEHQHPLGLHDLPEWPQLSSVAGLELCTYRVLPIHLGTTKQCILILEKLLDGDDPRMFRGPRCALTYMNSDDKQRWCLDDFSCLRGREDWFRVSARPERDRFLRGMAGPSQKCPRGSRQSRTPRPESTVSGRSTSGSTGPW